MREMWLIPGFSVLLCYCALGSAGLPRFSEPIKKIYLYKIRSILVNFRRVTLVLVQIWVCFLDAYMHISLEFCSLHYGDKAHNLKLIQSTRSSRN